MKKTFFILLASLALISCQNPAVSPTSKTLSGRMEMVANPCTTDPCEPGVALALCTPDGIYYVSNSYTEDDRYSPALITIGDGEFLVGDSVRLKGEVTTKLDIYNAEYSCVNVQSIEMVLSDVAGNAVPILYTSYVYSYNFPSEMRLEPDYFYQSSDSCIDSPYGFDVVFMAYDGVGQWQEGNKKEIFDSLAIKHGDTDFNDYVTYSSACPDMPHAYLGVDFASITVTSDTDIDERHPAGTPLNDIVQFMAYTPYPFIQSGYTYSNPQGDSWEKHLQEITLINKPLSECTPEDFILTLGLQNNWICGESFPVCYLLVKISPTSSKKHTITVSIVDDAGKTWQSSIVLPWSK